MREPVLFRDRSKTIQVLLVGIVPFAFGAVLGVVIGVSAGAYWVLAALAGIGAILAGFEHEDWRSGARRGLTSGVIFAAALLIAHAIADTHAKVSLGSFPPLLIVIDGIAGLILTAAGARLGRARWTRPEERG